MSPAIAEAAVAKATAEPAGRAPRKRPVPVREADAPRRGLGRVTRLLGTMREGNQLGRIGTLTAIALFASVFGVVVFQTLIVQGQARLDSLGTRAAAEQIRSKDLRHQVAQLESPERIVAAARDRLGMVSPVDVAYLTPTADDDARAAYTAPPPTAAPAPAPPKAPSSTKSTGKAAGPVTTPTTTRKSTTTTTVKPSTTTKPTTTTTVPSKAKKP
jgi:cell division protein FtsL